MLSLSIAPFKCGQCFRSYFDWNKYQSHQSLHHRNADFIVKRANLPVRNTVQPNVPTIQVNQSNVIFQQATTATKKAVIYPNRINLTDGVELVNRLQDFTQVLIHQDVGVHSACRKPLCRQGTSG